MQKNQKSFSDRLLELRGSSTQTVFAASIGVIQQTYAQWELGNRQPKIQELVRLAQHFGVSTDWLLGLSEMRQQPQNEDVNSDLLLRLNTSEAELRRYKSAFVKITRSLKSSIEVIEELQENSQPH